MQPAAVAQALALLLMVIAVNWALNAIRGLQLVCQQSTGQFTCPPVCEWKRSTCISGLNRLYALCQVS